MFKKEILIRTLAYAFTGLLVMSIAATAGYGQTPAALSPESQNLITEGIKADDQKDYLTAINYFQKALQTSPNSAQIFFYLGVEESKISGRELRAISWLSAYLLTRKDAPNASLVTTQIDKLNEAYRQSQLRLIRSAEDAARAVGIGLYLSSVAGTFARAGDLSSAMRMAAGIEYLPARRDAYAGISLAQANSGDIPGARSTANLIQDAEEKHRVQNEIVHLQITEGDIKGAMETWATMANLSELSGAEHSSTSAAAAIAEAQIKAGDKAGAYKTMAIALKNAEVVTDPKSKDFVYSDIVIALANCGDIALAQKTANMIPDVGSRAAALIYVPEAMARSGNIPKAIEMTQSIIEKDEYGFRYRDQAKGLIALVQANRGDMPGAKKTAALINDEDEKKYTLNEIAAVLKNRSDKITAPWLTMLEDSVSNRRALNLPIFLDLSAKLKSLPPSDDPEDLVNALIGIIDRMQDAQEYINQMRKKNVLHQPPLPAKSKKLR